MNRTIIIFKVIVEFTYSLSEIFEETKPYYDSLCDIRFVDYKKISEVVEVFKEFAKKNYEAIEKKDPEFLDGSLPFDVRKFINDLGEEDTIWMYLKEINKLQNISPIQLKMNNLINNISEKNIKFNSSNMGEMIQEISKVESFKDVVGSIESDPTGVLDSLVNMMKFNK